MQRLHFTDPATPPAVTRTERLALCCIFGAGLILRLWALAAKGLSYDEAATAVMARATPAEILDFHWHATFENPPLWQLIMHYWVRLLGQSEAMLRLLPAFAGALAIVATWWWLRAMWPQRSELRLVTAGIVATGPVLVQYSQEARMYALLLLGSALSLTATVYLIQRPAWGAALGFILVTWFCTGLHYYALILFGAEALFLAGQGLLQRAGWRSWAVWTGTLLLGALPIVAWMALAPGFRMTVVLSIEHEIPQPVAISTLLDLGRNLTVGSFRWAPPHPYWFLLLLPLVALGLLALAGADFKARAMPPWSGLVILVSAVPFAVNAGIVELTVARYVLFAALALYTLLAAAILWLWRLHPVAGLLGVGVVAAVAVYGSSLYFGDYQKSEYREMAAFLRARHEPGDEVILYTPRQHLLTKYYLPADWAYATAPAVVLPPYWPISPPRVTPDVLDDGLQAALRTHPVVWLVATGEWEVDNGEFVPKYLTAVAYEADCWAWLDVYLCRYLSPAFVTPQIQSAPDVLFNGELRLAQAGITQVPAAQGDQRTILAVLDWVAENKPTIDYRVTLRLVATDGTVVAQRDEYPIGPLLPPSTWAAGDEKPGYMALPLPAAVPPGQYRLVAGLYDPNTLTSFGELVELATLNLGK